MSPLFVFSPPPDFTVWGSITHRTENKLYIPQLKMAEGDDMNIKGGIKINSHCFVCGQMKFWIVTRNLVLVIDSDIVTIGRILDFGTLNG